MKFGSVPIADALGHIAAHSLRRENLRIKKGARLSEDDIAALTTAGIDQITVAQLDADDVHEDLAATQCADALVADPEAVNLRLSPAATGRVNVYATQEGIIQFDPDRINAFNAVDPMITIATVPPHHRVAKDGMVATIKIISYGVPAGNVTAACAIDARLALATGRFQTLTLIETTTDQNVPSDKGRRALDGRVAPLGVALSDRVIVDHNEQALADAIQDAVGDVICILTGSATSDTNDVAPSALRKAEGSVDRFGMPVDPGNLLFIGRFGAKPVIGLPGCARSPALNGVDWVLNRVLCGVAVTSADISAMGVGGLLKEIPTRPRLRDA